MLAIDKKNFEKEVLKEEKPVVIDFYAEWCGPCKIVSKVISELLEEGFADKVKFCIVDITKQNEFAKQYNVTSLPTLVFLKKGKEVARRKGMTTKMEFKQLIKNIL